MSLTTDKIYKIDDKPVSPMELIDYASEIDKPFNLMVLKRTSLAAAVIRSHGHTVTVNEQKENS